LSGPYNSTCVFAGKQFDRNTDETSKKDEKKECLSRGMKNEK
jgi:hypothetical protein